MAVPRDEYRQVLSRLDILEHDVAEIKADLRALNASLDQMIQHFETMFDRQNRHIETRFDVMNQRLDAMNERLLAQTRWMVGTIALFGTLITALLAISRFAP